MSPFSPRLPLLAALLVGCGDAELGPSWIDQLQPDSPCFRVNLLDGLDEDSTTEIHELFACLNMQGHLTALEPVDAATEVQTREATPIALELTRTLNHMGEVDVDPFALTGVLLDALQAPDRPVSGFLDLALELIYGVPAGAVRTGAVPVDVPASAVGGVLAPFRTVIPSAASALLEDHLRAAFLLGDILEDPELKRWIRSIEATLTSEFPGVDDRLDDLLQHTGDALLAAEEDRNDRWTITSGNSVRDLLSLAVLTEPSVVDVISEDVDAILSDDTIQASLPGTLEVLSLGGQLERTPAELTWMASVDIDGTDLDPMELSSLYRLARLISDTNKPMDCALYIPFTTIPIFEWTFPNLAVQTLTIIADMEPGTAVSLGVILTDITGNVVTEALLEEAVDADFCPDFTHQILDDFDAIEIISQPEAQDLLVVLIEVLNDLKYGDDDHIPTFADIVEDLYRTDTMPPLEEVLRDFGEGPLAGDLTDIIEVLADPERYGLYAGGLPAVDLDDVLDILHWTVAVDPDLGQTGFQRLRPVLAPVVAAEGTWEATHNLAVLLAEPGSQSSRALDLIPPLLASDPDLVVLDQLGPLLSDAKIAAPLMRIAESDAFLDTVLTTTAPEGYAAVPLTFAGELIVGGALEDLLAFIDLLVASLESEP